MSTTDIGCSMGILLHGPIETAHRNKFALCVSLPSRAIVNDSNLLGRLYCDAQRSVKDKENVKANSKRTRHCWWPAFFFSACDKGVLIWNGRSTLFGVGVRLAAW